VTAFALPRRLLAELLGAALLVTVVVGSGIAAAQLSPEDVGLQLLENSTAPATCSPNSTSPRPRERSRHFERPCFP
jgi:hypothetical protein